MKKILRVCHKFGVNDDGYDIGLREMVGLLKNDFEQHIVFFIDEKNLERYIEKNKLIKKNGLYYSKKSNFFIHPVHYYRKYNNYFKDLSLKENLSSFHENFKKIFKVVSPDFVHLHGTLIPQFKMAGKYGKKHGKKVITTHHGGQINKNSYQNLWIKLKKFLLHNSFPLFCDKIICLSNHGKKSFILNKNIEIIFGVKNVSIKRNKEIKNKGTRFIYPARYSLMKNQKILIKVWSDLIKEFPDLKLTLCGRISDYKYFKEINEEVYNSNLEKNIIILQGKSHVDLLNLLSYSDFLIFPSLNEGRGRIGLESLQLGVPVLASYNSGQSEHVIEGKNGLLFDPQSKDSIKECIKKAINMKNDFNTKLDEDIEERYINKLKGVYV